MIADSGVVVWRPPSSADGRPTVGRKRGPLPLAEMMLQCRGRHRVLGGVGGHAGILDNPAVLVFDLESSRRRVEPHRGDAHGDHRFSMHRGSLSGMSRSRSPEPSRFRSPTRDAAVYSTDGHARRVGPPGSRKDTDEILRASE